MPHDVNGNKLEVGDEVIVRCKVKQVTTGEDYCNVTLETVEPMKPSGTPYSISLNAGQTERVPPEPPSAETPA